MAQFCFLTQLLCAFDIFDRKTVYTDKIKKTFGLVGGSCRATLVVEWWGAISGDKDTHTLPVVSCN